MARRAWIGILGRSLAGIMGGLALLTVCAPAGDLGRPDPSIFEGLLPKQWILGPVTSLPGNPLTDAEEELRNRSYALIRPPQQRDEWNLILASLRVAKVLPVALLSFDRTAYGKLLVGLQFRSEAGRYSRLIDDVNSDIELIGPFVAVACYVLDMDAKREKSLVFVGAATSGEIADADARIDENRLVVEWVGRALDERAWSYRYAVERLVIASPSPIAIEAERAIDRFRAVIGAVGPYLVRCAGGAPVVLRSHPPAQRLITK